MRLRLFGMEGGAADCELELVAETKAYKPVGVSVVEGGPPSGVKAREDGLLVVDPKVDVSIFDPDAGTLFGQSLDQTASVGISYLYDLRGNSGFLRSVASGLTATMIGHGATFNKDPRTEERLEYVKRKVMQQLLVKEIYSRLMVEALELVKFFESISTQQRSEGLYMPF